MEHVRVEPCEQHQIEEYPEIAREFFEELLNTDTDDHFVISDESALSDFSSCGMPEETDSGSTLESLYDTWDKWIILEIEKRYGIKLENTGIYLVTLFEMIKQSRERSTH